MNQKICNRKMLWSFIWAFVAYLFGVNAGLAIGEHRLVWWLIVGGILIGPSLTVVALLIAEDAGRYDEVRPDADDLRVVEEDK